MPSPYNNKLGSPELKTSVVCFLDVLGYRTLFAEGVSATDQAISLSKMHSALTEASQNFNWWKSDKTSLSIARPFELKSFTDNIVIGWPIAHDGEHELGMMFDQIADFQIWMTSNDFFVRGAVAVGPAYLDDLGVFGSGLMEAYRGEAKLALHPRIVLMPSAKSYVQQHLKYYHYPEHSPQSKILRQDSDGQWFINYLENLIGDANEGIVFPLQLELHQRHLIKQLKAHATEPRVWAKYEWAARYHNQFCAENVGFFGPEFLIDISSIMNPIGSIVRPKDQI